MLVRTQASLFEPDFKGDEMVDEVERDAELSIRYVQLFMAIEYNIRRLIPEAIDKLNPEEHRYISNALKELVAYYQRVNEDRWRNVTRTYAMAQIALLR
jgi:hypothetical protein